ncbi:MAG: RnfH family protein [Arenimonas sp.]|nr:RnfH family protein [Arenimonas sp.]MBP7917250.1 RnfH family protein [Arenimonas sp.]
MTESIQVQIVYAMPVSYWRQELHLPVNSTLQEALALLDKSLFPADMVIDSGRLAVYGQRAKPGDRLCAMDRIEVLRPLVFDPKDNRRQRAAMNPLKKPKR